MLVFYGFIGLTLDVCGKKIETSTYQTVHQRFPYQVDQCNSDDFVTLHAVECTPVKT